MDDVVADLPKFEIPLVFKKKKIGVIEAIGFNPDTEFPTIVFSGKLFHMLDEPSTLVKLLQAEGIHLGK